MGISLACSTSDHTNCARPSCTCWCDHPERALMYARAGELLARPDPMSPVSRRARAAVAAVERPAPAPKAPRPRRVAKRPAARPARPKTTAPRAPKPPPAPRIKPLPIDEIIAAYQRGVGAQHGVSSGTILKRLRAAGIPIRRQGDRTIHLPDDEIAARYEAGETCAAIAAAYDVAETTIAHHLRTRGITLRTSRRIELPVRDLVLRYGLGWSIEDLAEQSGCAPQTIRRRLLDEGVTIRAAGHRSVRARTPGKATVVTNDAGQRICPVCRTTVLVKKNPHGPGRYPNACETCR